MTSYGIEEARKRLGDLITAAQQGEKITITRNGKPAVQLAKDVELCGATHRSDTAGNYPCILQAGHSDFAGATPHSSGDTTWANEQPRDKQRYLDWLRQRAEADEILTQHCILHEDQGEKLKMQYAETTDRGAMYVCPMDASHRVWVVAVPVPQE